MARIHQGGQGWQLSCAGYAVTSTAGRSGVLSDAVTAERRSADAHQQEDMDMGPVPYLLRVRYPWRRDAEMRPVQGEEEDTGPAVQR